MSFVILPYLILVIIFSLVLYLRKEKILFIITGTLFLVSVIGLTIFARDAEMKGLAGKKQIEELEEFILEPLLEKAIKDGDPGICEELKK